MGCLTHNHWISSNLVTFVRCFVLEYFRFGVNLHQMQLPHFWSSNLSKIWLVFAATVLLSFVFFHSVGSESSAIQRHVGWLRISDFACYLAAAQAVFKGTASNIYGYSDQAAILSYIYGSPVQSAFILGLTPIFLLVFAPFVVLSDVSFTLANSLFLALSCLTLLSGGMQLVRAMGLAAAKLGVWNAVFLVLTLISEAFLYGLAVGQLTILASGILCWLVADYLRSSNLLPRWSIVAALVFLAVKPIYLLMGMAVVVGSRRQREFWLALVAIAFVLLVATPVIGLYWPVNYLEALGYFSAATPAPEYRGVFSFETAPLMRTALGTFVTQDVLVRLGSISCIGGSLLLLFWSFLRPLQRGGYMLPALALYFATTPYVGTYEVLLFLPAICQFSQACRSALVWGTASAGVLLILMNYQSWSLPLLPVWILFPLLLFWWLSMAWLGQRTATPSATSSH